MYENERFDAFDGWNFEPGYEGLGRNGFCGQDVIVDHVCSKTVPVAVEFKRVHKHMFETEEPLPPRRLIERPARRCGNGYVPGYGCGYNGYGRY